MISGPRAGRPSGVRRWLAGILAGDLDAFVVPGFSPGMMPRTYDGALSQQQITDVIAYMLTLR